MTAGLQGCYKKKLLGSIKPWRTADKEVWPDKVKELGTMPTPTLPKAVLQNLGDRLDGACLFNSPIISGTSNSFN